MLEGDEHQLVVADIPGLIEGASEGAGLGDDFLAHVERTRLLVHVLDVAPELSAGEGADARDNHETIERELAAHDERLARLPRILALSKADLVTEEQLHDAVAAWRERLGGDVSVIATSSATGAGIAELSNELLRGVAPRALEAVGADAATDMRGAMAEDELPEHVVLRPAEQAGFRVERLGPRRFAVHGRGIERLVERYDVENDDALAYLEERLRRIGVLRALEAEGFRPGDEVEVAGVSFALDPGAAA
jgi:GTP-binding protein